MSTPPRAGWYDDPDVPDQLRYFDGVTWTSHTTPRSRFSSPAPETAPSATPVPPVAAARPSIELALAPLGTRLVAYVVDKIIVSLLTVLAGFWLVLRAMEPIRTDLESASLRGDLAAVLTMVDRLDRTYLLAYMALGLAVSLAYHVGFLVKRSATPGKLMLGLRVQQLSRPGPVDRDTAVKRAGFEALLSALSNTPVVSLIGLVLTVADCVWPIADPRRQALHDKIAGTVVVIHRA